MTVGVARFYGLGSEHDSLQSRTAHLVNRKGTGFNGNSCIDRGLTGGVLPQSRGEHVAHDHFIDLLHADAGPKRGLCYYDGSESRRGNIFQRSAELADSGPHRAYENDLFSHNNPLQSFNQIP